MHSNLTRLGMVAGLCWIDSSYAMDSYRFLHVTIDTPWFIFIFLMGAIFVPFVLMATLVWRYAERKSGKEKPFGETRNDDDHN